MWFVLAACGVSPAPPPGVPPPALVARTEPPPRVLGDLHEVVVAVGGERLPGLFVPGDVRVIALDHEPTWMSVAPDGSVALTGAWVDGRPELVLSTLDLDGGIAPLPPPVERGEVWLPAFLDSDGEDWRVAARWTDARGSRAQGIYTFRLGDPAGTWAPWAVTGTHVREFWLVEDRTALVTLSFVPDGRRDSDRVDVTPIVGGAVDPTRSYRVAPELRAVQFESWDERRHRLSYQVLDKVHPDGTTGPFGFGAFESVPLEAGARSQPDPQATQYGQFWNPLGSATDVVRAVGTRTLDLDAIASDGSRKPLLRFDRPPLCRFLAFSPVDRELYFAVRTRSDRRVVLATSY